MSEPASKHSRLVAEEMQTIDREFARVLERIPLRQERVLPPEWLHIEMVERFRVLEFAEIRPSSRILEVGSGAHAIASVPLAFLVGEKGQVTCVEVERWSYFNEIVSSSGLKRRISPLECNAEMLPLISDSFDTAVTIHGIRSFRNEQTIVQILSEMLRVAPRILVVESLPISRTPGQQAHLQMYDLREDVFEAVLGAKDDIHYFALEKLTGIVRKAGGNTTQSRILEVGLPHYLAFIPRDYVEKISDQKKRDVLLARWDLAYDRLVKYGEEQPPIAVISAERQC